MSPRPSTPLSASRFSLALSTQALRPHAHDDHAHDDPGRPDGKYRKTVETQQQKHPEINCYTTRTE